MKGDSVLRHRPDGVRRRTGGSADAPVIEGDDRVFCGDAVDDPGVPVVQDPFSTVHAGNSSKPCSPYGEQGFLIPARWFCL